MHYRVYAVVAWDHVTQEPKTSHEGHFKIEMYDWSWIYSPRLLSSGGSSSIFTNEAWWIRRIPRWTSPQWASTEQRLWSWRWSAGGSAAGRDSCRARVHISWLDITALSSRHKQSFDLQRCSAQTQATVMGSADLWPLTLMSGLMFSASAPRLVSDQTCVLCSDDEDLEHQWWSQTGSTQGPLLYSEAQRAEIGTLASSFDTYSRTGPDPAPGPSAGADCHWLHPHRLQPGPGPDGATPCVYAAHTLWPSALPNSRPWPTLVTSVRQHPRGETVHFHTVLTVLYSHTLILYLMWQSR